MHVAMYGGLAPELQPVPHLCVVLQCCLCCFDLGLMLRQVYSSLGGL
jgi:hypothetical protein